MTIINAKVNLTYGNKHLEYAISCENSGLYGDALIWYHKAYMEYETAKTIAINKDFELLTELKQKISFACKKMEEMENKLQEKPKQEDTLEL